MSAVRALGAVRGYRNPRFRLGCGSSVRCHIRGFDHGFDIQCQVVNAALHSEKPDSQ